MQSHDPSGVVEGDAVGLLEVVEFTDVKVCVVGLVCSAVLIVIVEVVLMLVELPGSVVELVEFVVELCEVT